MCISYSDPSGAYRLELMFSRTPIDSLPFLQYSFFEQIKALPRYPSHVPTALCLRIRATPASSVSSWTAWPPATASCTPRTSTRCWCCCIGGIHPPAAGDAPEPELPPRAVPPPVGEVPQPPPPPLPPPGVPAEGPHPEGLAASCPPPSCLCRHRAFDRWELCSGVASKSVEFS